MLHKREVIVYLIVLAPVSIISSGLLALLSTVYLPRTAFDTVSTWAFAASVIFGASCAAVLLWLLTREAYHSGCVTEHMTKFYPEENVLELRRVGNSIVRSTVAGTPSAPLVIVPPGDASPNVQRVPIHRTHLTQDPDTVEEVNAEQWQAFLNVLAQPATKNGNRRGSYGDN
jgi:hypothetical protein